MENELKRFLMFLRAKKTGRLGFLTCDGKDMEDARIAFTESPYGKLFDIRSIFPWEQGDGQLMHQDFNGKSWEQTRGME